MIILVIGGGMFMYAIMYKPEWVAIFLLTLIISNINIELKALPLNVRAIMVIALVGRIITDKSQKVKIPSFLAAGSVKLFLFYWFYVLMVTAGQGLFSFDLLKATLSTVLSAYCCYHFFFVKGNSNVLRTAVILAGLICFADLAYTYIVYGGFPVQRLYSVYTGAAPEAGGPDDIFAATVNHNFFGQICGMAFLFIFSDLIKNRDSSRYTIILLPVMFLGVLMSTSRSALMGLLIISIIIIYNGVKYKESQKKVYKIGSFALVAITVSVLLFSTLGMYFKLNSKFVDEVIFRLTEEPMAILQRAMGQNYNVQNLGSMDWREEASSDAYAAYGNLPLIEQLTGVGTGGFLERKIGHGYNAHNGILLILIETGLIGLVLYFALILGVMIRAIRLKIISPSFCIVGFTLIYGIGQNGEMTSITTFLFVATIIAEIQYQLSGFGKKKYSLDRIPAQ